MKCPVCNDVRMREVEKDGVLIDVCPDCKGVWLDRGELEKLLKEINDIRPSFREWEESRGYDEYGQQMDPRHQQQYSNFPPNQGNPQNQGYPQDRNYKQNYKGYPKHKKKKNVLDVFGDLFD